MSLARHRVTEPAALRALAHPVRLALLELLVARGPMTASEASVEVRESPSNCSWHLRKLAEHGFVRESRGAGGRHRPWQAVGEGLAWGDAEEPVVAEALSDVLVDREVQRFRAARAARGQESREWQQATGPVRAQVWLTAAEAQEARDALARLLDAYRDRATEPGSRPPDARLVSLVGWLVPSGPLAPHAPGAPSPSDGPSDGPSGQVTAPVGPPAERRSREP